MIRIAIIDDADIICQTIEEFLISFSKKNGVSIDYDSIINNIVLDKSIDYERVKHICKICNILDDIEELPNKFETIISENGDSFSGGQKSRLCLVRALYKELPVLIIDEVTSGLDGITECSIKENLSEIVNEKIVIIVTHSKNFIMNNSIIYNIDNCLLKLEEPSCLK